jgi:hypothetical protein
MLYPDGKGGFKIGRMRYDLMWCSFSLGLLDFLLIPMYILATLHPWQIADVFVSVLMTKRINYTCVDFVEKGESIRRGMVLWLAGKTLSDFFRYFLYFPINMLSLYFVPLFFYSLNHDQLCVPEERTE